jgi:peptidyl-prolyl cis-trans isomerase C
MKKLLYCALGVFLAMSMGCKGKGDVLATYKNGQITRGEFYEWIEAKHLNKAEILKSKKYQENKLRMMAIDRLCVIEARKEGLDQTEEFKLLAERAEEGQLMDLLYQKEIRENSKFSEPAVRVRQIFLKFKDPKQDKGKKPGDADVKKERDAAIENAKELIAQLEKGAKFDELAKQHSADFSKKNGGDIGFVLYDMMPPDFSKAAFALKEGEYTKEPVVLENGVYILKSEEKDELTEKQIRKLKDKNQASMLLNRFYAKASKEYVDQLMQADDVAKYPDKAVSKNPRDVIFKIGDRSFTVEDLNKRVQQQSGKKGGEPMTDEKKKTIADNYMKMELLRRMAIAKGYDKDEEYLSKASISRDAILAGEYIKKIGTVNITVSEKEILEEYNENKDKRYYTYVKKGNDREKVVEPLAKVREKIKEMIENRKRSDILKKWKDDILGANEFAADMKKFEGE